MSLHKYVVHLKPQQRDLLLHLTRSEIRPTHHKVCARVLLQTDRNQPGEPPTDEQVARSLNISSRTVHRIKARFLQGGLVWALRGAYPKEQLTRRKLSEEPGAFHFQVLYQLSLTLDARVH